MKHTDCVDNGETLSTEGGGGGGGTFVYKDCSNPLIIAGGGVGGNDHHKQITPIPNSIHGQTSEDIHLEVM